MILVNEAEALLLKELLDNRHLVVDNIDSPEARELMKQVVSELEDIERKKIAPLTVVQREAIQARLLEIVTTEKPKFLMDGHDEDWFFINGRGQKVWNFRNATQPALEVVRELGWMDQYLNTEDHVLHNITNAVKRHRLVKPIKARAK